MPFPTIDLSPYLRAPFPSDPSFPSAEQRDIARMVDDCFRGVGIMFVRDITVTADVLSAMNEVSKRLFEIPDEEKRETLMPMKKGTNMGYLPFSIETLNADRGPDIKETYNFQFGDGHNQDFRGCPSSFAATARKFWDSITVTARALCIACSVALDLPSDYFLSALRSNASSTIRLLHYPSCTFTPSAAAGGGAIRAGEHTDFGLFTFLFTDGTGLQARANKSSELEEVDGNGRKGEWIDVDFPPPKSETTTSIVVLGALMSRWTNDAWPAAAHRVIVPDEIQARMNRLTIACFFQPDPEFIVSVHPNFVSQENPSKYKPIKAFDYLSVRLEHAKASVPESELEQETNGI